jgi:hypothetical protein
VKRGVSFQCSGVSLVPNRCLLAIKRCLLGTYSVDFDIKNDRLGYVAQNGRYDDILKRDGYALWLLERFCSRQSVGVQPSRALNMR